MTPAEYRDALAALSLSQVRAASLFGVDARTSRRWALGEAAVPRMVALVLRLMLRHGVTADEAMKLGEPRQ